MLIGNYNVLNKTPNYQLGGATNQGLDGKSNAPLGRLLNRFSHFSQLAATPYGYTPGSAIVPARKSGGISAALAVSIAFSTTTPSLAEGRNLAGDTTFTFTVPSASLELVVSATGTATLTFSSTATLAGALEMAGSATFTFSSGTVTLGALAGLFGDGTIVFSGAATPGAIGYLEGDITPFTTLSPENLALYILDTNDVETGLSVRQALRLIAAATGGKVSGAETTTVTIRNAVADDADRIVATVDADGNRTAITYDLD